MPVTIAEQVESTHEAFEAGASIVQAHAMWRDGRLRARPDVQFVMGMRNAMPATHEVFEFDIRTVGRLFGEDAPRCAAGIGAGQIVLSEWSVASGGHARTGLEDDVRPDRDRLAPSNAAPVARLARIRARRRRPVATWRQARAIPGLDAGRAACPPCGRGCSAMPGPPRPLPPRPRSPR